MRYPKSLTPSPTVANSVAVELGTPAGLNRKRRLQDSNGIREICGGLVDIVHDSVEDEDVSEDEDSSEEGNLSEDEDASEGDDASEEGNLSEDEDASEGDDASKDGEARVEISYKDPRTSDLPPARTVPTVRIAHFSVQEYLESKRISDQKAVRFGLSSMTAHAKIAEVCLIYLLEPGLSGSKLNKAILEEYPLAKIAATYWYYHYKKTENPTSGLDTCILRLFQNQTSFVTWVRLHDVDSCLEPHFVENHWPAAKCIRRLDDIPTPIYYASLLGLDKVLHELLRFEQVESTKLSAPLLTTTPKAFRQTVSAAGRYGGAMQVASYYDNDHIIQILLDSGFDINDQGEWGEGSALLVASSQGHAKVVQMLLDRGADVNAQNEGYGSVLQAALRRGFKEIVQILLDRGADVNAQSEKYGSALQAASGEGFEEIVQILLDRGADVNAQNERYGSVLQAALRRGFKEIVQMLLDRGADINAQSRRYGSALQAASDRGFEEIVQMLLVRGADVNAQNNDRSALQAASAEGWENIVQMLCDRGADPNVQHGWNSTALCVASERGSSHIVRILLDGGARVSISRNRALLGAICRGHRNTAQILLNSMNAEDFDNEWRMASSQGDNEIIGLLETHDFPFRHKLSVTEEA